MNIKIVYPAIISMLLFSACSAPYSEAPIATNFKTTNQLKLQSLYHWKVISANMVKVLISKIPNKSIYIYPNNTNQFNNIFSDFLREELLNNGIKVKRYDTLTSTYLKYNVKIVKLNKDISSFRNMVGVPTALAAGVWFINKFASKTISGVPTMVFGAAAATEATLWFNSKEASGNLPKYEVSITIDVYNKNEYLSTINRVYYVSDLDYNLYSYHRPPVLFKVKGE